MPGKEIIVVGASTGGIDALKVLASGLPADFPASVFIVLHTAPHSLGILPEILERAGNVCARWEKCGKSNCRCARGELHGSYYYRCCWKDGRQHKSFIRKANFTFCFIRPPPDKALW